MAEQSSIIHINITDFAASVAALRHPELACKPFVIVKPTSERSTVIAVSPAARSEGIRSGMSFATALHLVPKLHSITPDAASCSQVDTELKRIACCYSPVVQADTGGHLYVDASGTTRLFGPPVDSAARIRRQIQYELGLDPAIAVASNKLVAKVGTRTLRPSGLAAVPMGQEASFLALQDISLLPGVGEQTLRLLRLADFTIIGELAALDEQQAHALLGRKGVLLRQAAQGIDASSIDTTALKVRAISRHIDFDEPALQFEAMRAALICASEEAGFEMRSLQLCSQGCSVSLYWADGVKSEGSMRTTALLRTDAHLIQAAELAYKRAFTRRVRVRSFTLSMQHLTPFYLEADLFAALCPLKTESLQETVDTVRRRFGPRLLTKAATMYHG